MKATWKTYLLYGSLLIVGIVLFLLEETIRYKNTGFEGKTLWEWMELLIIPLFLAGGALFLQQSERAVERKAATDRADLERELATDRQQEAALQAYLDRMAELLLEKGLRTSENEEVRNVARIRTLTVLRGLDAKRKGMVLLFLHESGIIADKPVLDLSRADLSGADLSGVNLFRANLSEANLSEANLLEAILLEANLSEANLSRANLSKANLLGANLSKANMSGVYLIDADLKRANLTEANLSRANLTGADLKRANLTEANLRRANLTEANLTEANLKGATMPDGTKHE